MNNFYYCREHDHEMGWSLKKDGNLKALAYGDKNLMAGLAFLLNQDDRGTSLIKDMAKFL